MWLFNSSYLCWILTSIFAVDMTFEGLIRAAIVIYVSLGCC